MPIPPNTHFQQGLRLFIMFTRQNQRMLGNDFPGKHGQRHIRSYSSLFMLKLNLLVILLSLNRRHSLSPSKRLAPQHHQGLLWKKGDNWHLQWHGRQFPIEPAEARYKVVLSSISTSSRKQWRLHGTCSENATATFLWDPLKEHDIVTRRAVDVYLHMHISCLRRPFSCTTAWKS